MGLKCEIAVHCQSQKKNSNCTNVGLKLRGQRGKLSTRRNSNCTNVGLKSRKEVEKIRYLLTILIAPMWD